MKVALALALGLAAASSAGCGRAHLEAGYGRSYRAQFAAQRDRPTGASPAAKNLTGLDAQEASIIAQTYRRSLAPKEVEEKAQPILVVAPNQPGSAQPALPPPSVPKER